MPFTNEDCTSLTETIQQYEQAIAGIESRIQKAKKKICNKKELLRLNSDLEFFKEKHDEAVNDLAFILDYLQRNGEDYAISKGEKSDLYTVCIGYAYGMAIYRSATGELLYEEMEAECAEIGFPCDDFSSLCKFSELPEGEQRLIINYLMQRSDARRWVMRYSKDNRDKTAK